MSGDIFSSQLEKDGVVLLVSSGQGPGVLLDTLQCTGGPTAENRPA